MKQMIHDHIEIFPPALTAREQDRPFQAQS